MHSSALVKADIATLPDARKRWVLVLCCIPFVMAQLDATIVNVALPTISRDLHASLASLQWIVSAYVMVLSSLLIFSGTLADRFGRRRNIIIGLAIFVVGSALCGLAPSTGWLIAFRCLQAIGAALISPATLATLTTMNPEHGARARAIGWWAGMGGVGLAIGPLLGGFLVEYLSWRWIFYLNVLPGIAAIVLCWFSLPESRSAAPRRFDIAGVLLLIVAVFALAHSIIESSTYGWTSSAILGGFAVALAVLIAFVLTARHRPDPVIPLPLFRDWPFTRSVLTVLLGTTALAALLFVTTLYLQDVRHLSPVQAGLITLPMVMLSSGGAIVAGRLVAGGHSRGLLLFSGSGIAVAALLFYLVEPRGVGWILVPFIAFGAAYGVLNNPVNVTAVSELSDSLAGMASSVVSTFRQFGQVLGVALVGTLTSGHLASETARETDAQFGTYAVPVWLLVAGCGLAIVALNLGRGHRHRGAAPSSIPAGIPHDVHPRGHGRLL